MRQKIIVKDNESEFQLEIPAEDSFAKLQESSVTYRFATGPNKGKKAMVLKTVPENDHTTNWGLVVKNSGFSPFVKNAKGKSGSLPPLKILK